MAGTSRRWLAFCAALLAAISLAAFPPSAQAASPTLARPWTVAHTDAGWRVSLQVDGPARWRDDLPVLLADGRRLGIARQSPDGRTFTVTTSDPRVRTARTVELGYASDASGAARKRTGAPSGPAVTGSGPGGRVTVPDPSVPGPYPVEQRDYNLGDTAVYLPGIGRRSELLGRLYLPKGATGRRPVVLLLHGMHAACYGEGGGGGHLVEEEPWPCPADTNPVPNHLGYAGMARTLASQGYVVTSISANAVNIYSGQAEDFGQTARGELTLAHLDLLRDGNAGTGALRSLRGRVDLGRVGLMGHSRGGEGVVRATLANSQRSHPYGIQGLFLIAPTDFGRLTVPGVSTTVVLPYCDGDVSDLRGQHYLDDTRYSVRGDRSFRSGLLVLGANHNYFNTEWSPGSVSEGGDDWGYEASEVCGAEHPDRLSPAEQRAVGATYLTGFFRVTLGGQRRFLPLFDGSGAMAASTGRAVVRSTYSAPAPARLDVAGLQSAAPRATGGATLEICAGMIPINLAPGELPDPVPSTDLRHPACTDDLDGPQASHWSPTPVGGAPPGTAVGHLTWSKATGRASFALPRSRRDVRGYDALTVRMAPDPAAAGAQDLTLRVTDRKGRRVDVAVSSVSDALAPLPGSGELLPRTQLRLVRVPLSRLRGLDLRGIRSVSLVTNRTTAGSVYVADVAFNRTSAGRSGMPRLPVIELTGTPRLDEGPAGTTSQARFEIRLSRAVPYPVAVRFSAVRDTGEGLPIPNESVVIPRVTRRVVVPAGRTRVPVSVAVIGNDRFGVPQGMLAGLSAPREAVLGRNTGTGLVLNDDPMPVLTVASGSAVEGDGVLRFPLTLSAPADQGAGVDVRLVDGSAVFGRDYGLQEEEVEPVAFGFVDVGQTTGFVEVPLIDDGTREPTETFVAEIGELFNATPPPGGNPPVVGTIRDDDGQP